MSAIIEGQGEASDDRLRQALDCAEAAAREAVAGLLADIGSAPECVRVQAAIVADYVKRCQDPFQALDIARMLRALVVDVDAGIYNHGNVTEWAYAEIRLTALVARTCRLLGDERQPVTEGAVFVLGARHLELLEQSPRFLSIFTEMARILDSGGGVQPRSAATEFFGLGRSGKSPAPAA